ncbi:hypothetical protein EG68_02402 [Paragonimus skrjabini miyazakii]|uniref:receptor protein-tyrosine kinase n=1 Tax=Paragonimus skrjabini miyazakii TaxID=59628 RepID=A0A8S9Z0I9_9TREM|nr:hypothetical protein EG68_02402 [Paragonimus skrjabini miyazakii]
MYSNVANLPLTNLRVIRAENGGYHIRNDLEPAAMVIRRNYKNGISLRNIDFQNLKSIVRGSVYMYDNPGLCFWSQHIHWHTLFETPGEQRVVGKQVVEENNPYAHLESGPHDDWSEVMPSVDCQASNCSEACLPFSDGQRHCWDSSPTGCQIESRCSGVLCDRCYRDGQKQFCCHEQCLGGCTGPLPTQCEACKEFNDNGTCRATCPRRTTGLIDPTSTRLASKYRMSNFCVIECAPGFLIENDACVTHCIDVNAHPIGKICQPCDGQCPKVCELSYPRSRTGFELKVLNAENLRNLTNCTYLRGDLVIANESFYPSVSVVEHKPITHVDQLWAMHSLQEISGYVYLDLGFFGTKLVNLSFLENLVKVGGYLPAVRASVMVMNSGAVIPGLRSLRQVPHGRVEFFNNSRMCYLQSLPWLVSSIEEHRDHLDQPELVDHMQLHVADKPDEYACAAKGAVCHPNCDPTYGCWGPGLDQCVRCLNRRAGEHSCVLSCDELPGFLSEHTVDLKAMNLTSQKQRLDDDRGHRNVSVDSKNNWVTVDPTEAINHVLTGSPYADQVCVPCHPECQRTCTGPGPHQCIGECKTAWADGRCVSECDRRSFLNLDLRVCEPCQTHCHQRQTTHLPICTGPGRHPGPGGCNKCERLLVRNTLDVASHLAGDLFYRDLQSLSCHHGDCPSGTYLTSEIIRPDSVFAHVAETFASVLPICRPCHPLCARCSAPSLTEAQPHRLGCIECVGFWFRETCVEQCPEKDTYTIELPQSVTPTGLSTVLQNGTQLWPPNSTGNSTRQLRGRCLACHVTCSTGCWGPESSQCSHCLNWRVYLSLLPPELLQANPDLAARKQNISMQQPVIDQLPVHEIFGSFVCVNTCPIGLNYHILDPSTRDQLCHFESTLSASHRDHIFVENRALTRRVQHTSIPSYGSNSREQSTHATVALLWLTILSICVVVSVISYCFFRARKLKWMKVQNDSDALGRNAVKQFLLCPSLGNWVTSASSYSDEFGSKLNTTFNSKSETVEMNTTSSSIHDSLASRTAGLTESQYDSFRSTRMAPKAPNLGRLVMIQSDDLILDETFGPLGTGAFGAVYRGMWKVPDHESTPGTSYQSDTSIDDHRPQSTQSATTLMTTLPSPSEDDEEDVVERPLLTGLIAKPTAEKNQTVRYKLLPVAVKILNDVRGSSDLQALLDEAKVMASVSHRHCLPLLGVCLSQTRKCLVSAYVVNGSLERYLRLHAPALPSQLLLEWASQIADGMAYLQSCGIIHRDLATRNVLVTTKDHLQITDFGLAKMLEPEDEENKGEVIVRSGRVPIRWLAIETLAHGRYSFKTDVWAYGVTTWEIFTFGEKPYERIETSNVKAHILSGGRLPQPVNCSLELYQLMLKCWNENPQMRPNFIELFGCFNEFKKHPDVYLHSRASSSMTTVDLDSSVGGVTRSRLTIYPSSQLSTERQDPRPLSEISANDKTSPTPVRLFGWGNVGTSGNGPSTSSRRFDPRRRMRCSVPTPQTQSLQAGKFVKFQQHKRRSIGSRADTNTLSTSLSMTSSGMSDHWSHSTFPHHSHPTLVEAKEGNAVTADTRQTMVLCSGDPSCSSRPFNQGDGCNTESWASSGQPLLFSDQDSSMSQLMLSNFGYTSSDSHSSMLNRLAGTSTLPSIMQLPNDPENCQIQHVPESCRSNEIDRQPTVPSPNAPEDRGLRNALPADFELEAAAGYVWPQWPSALTATEQLNADTYLSDCPQIDLNHQLDGGSDEHLLSLNRQLWLRRNARQRQYYQRQSQLRRSAIGTSLPEQITEETVEEATSWQQPGDNPLFNESDAEETGDRYCPDPTSINAVSQL